MDARGLEGLTAPQRARLDRLVAAFCDDERVVSGWLGGSLGGEGFDRWSNIDFHVMVRGETLADFGAVAYERLLGCGAPLMHWPGLSTEAVATFAAFYEDGTCVDLHVHSAAHGATFLTAGPIRVLFGEEPHGEPFAPAPMPQRRDAVAQGAFRFWLQLYFAAKYIDRGDPVMAAGYLACARGTLVQMLQLRHAHPLWTGPPITWGTYGQLTERERAVIEGSQTARGPAELARELAALVAAADELLLPLAQEAGCADYAQRVAATVKRILDSL